MEMPPVALQYVSILVENMWHLENINLLPTETILYFQHGVLSLLQPRHSCKWTSTILLSSDVVYDVFWFAFSCKLTEHWLCLNGGLLLGMRLFFHLDAALW